MKLKLFVSESLGKLIIKIKKTNIFLARPSEILKAISYEVIPLLKLLLLPSGNVIIIIKKNCLQI